MNMFNDHEISPGEIELDNEALEIKTELQIDHYKEKNLTLRMVEYNDRVFNEIFGK